MNRIKAFVAQKRATRAGADHSPKYDWVAKIVCLFLAIILWMYVMQMNTIEEDTTLEDLPIEIINEEQLEDAGLSIYSGYDQTMDITLRGKRSEIAKLSAENVHARVDVSGISTAGTYPLDVRMTLPSGITEVSRTVSNVSVYIDVREMRNVDVEVEFGSFSIPSMYELGIAQPAMDYVTVSGPREELSKIQSAVVRVDLGQVQSSVTSSGTVVLVDAEGNTISNPYISLSAETMEVTVPVYMEKQVSVKVTSKYGYLNESNSTITADPSAVTLKGDPAVLQSLNEVIFEVDEKQLSTVETELHYAVDLPEGVELLGEEDTVTVTVRNVGTVTKQLTVDQILVRNTNGVKYRLRNDTLTVTLRGPSELMEALSVENVRAIVDLSSFDDASAGAVYAPVEIKVYGFDTPTIYEIGTYTMSVLING